MGQQRGPGGGNQIFPTDLRGFLPVVPAFLIGLAPVPFPLRFGGLVPFIAKPP
jgi:hypothetical protein